MCTFSSPELTSNSLLVPLCCWGREDQKGPAGKETRCGGKVKQEEGVWGTRCAWPQVHTSDRR